MLAISSWGRPTFSRWATMQHLVCSTHPNTSRKESWEHGWGLQNMYRRSWVMFATNFLHLALKILTFQCLKKPRACLHVVSEVFIWFCKCLMKPLLAAAFFLLRQPFGRETKLQSIALSMHFFVHVLIISDTDHNLQKAGGSSGFQCFSLIFFKWPSIFYITEFSTASITVQSTHFPAKSILRCEVPAGLWGCFCSSPQSVWGILCFKSSSFSKPFKWCQSTTVFLVWTKKGLGVCVWRDMR